MNDKTLSEIDKDMHDSFEKSNPALCTTIVSLLRVGQTRDQIITSIKASLKRTGVNLDVYPLTHAMIDSFIRVETRKIKKEAKT
jgi:hypothetical protein